jgi:hypothetical protein
MADARTRAGLLQMRVECLRIAHVREVLLNDRLRALEAERGELRAGDQHQRDPLALGRLDHDVAHVRSREPRQLLERQLFGGAREVLRFERDVVPGEHGGDAVG